MTASGGAAKPAITMPPGTAGTAPAHAAPPRLPWYCLLVPVAVVLPIPLGAVYWDYRSAHATHYEPLAHALVEGFCGVMALVVFYVLRSEGLALRSGRLGLMAQGYLALGLLTLLHAMANPGSDAFVLLHCVSGLSAGMIFALARWQVVDIPRRPPGLGGSAVLAAAILAAGAVILRFGDMVGSTHSDGGFAMAVLVTNVAASIGFALASCGFFVDLRRTRAPIFLVFAVAMLLFAEMHGLFLLSRLWDVHWWAWHLVKAFIFLSLLAGLAYEFATVLRDAMRRNGELADAYDKLAATQSSLLEAEKLAALGQMAAVLAHEIRNPLGTLTNCLGVLRRKYCAPEETAEMVGLMDKEVERLDRLVAETLSAAHDRSVRLQAVDLGCLVKDVLRTLACRLGGLVLDCRCPSGTPPVNGSEQHLRQLVVNLVTNATDAMTGTGRLTVSVGGDGEAVLLQVADTGPGMSKDVLDRLFEPFLTTKPQGTGLGLAIVKRIAVEHGAEIAIDSRPGSGTTFKLRFPAAKAQTMTIGREATHVARHDRRGSGRSPAQPGDRVAQGRL